MKHEHKENKTQSKSKQIYSEAHIYDSIEDSGLMWWFREIKELKW